MNETGRLDPTAAFAAFGRVAYGDAVSVVLLSLCFVLVSLPVITLGPAALALVDVVTGVVADETRGAKTTERERLRRFAEGVRANVVPGAALSVLLVGAVAAEAAYLSLALSTGRGLFLVGAAVGMYVLLLAVVLSLRAGSFLARGAPSLRAAGRDAALHLAETPSFTVLYAFVVGVLVLVCAAVGVAVPLLLPGLLAVLEVVAFEEQSGVGAETVVRAYRGEFA
jgi:hypothetical protein